MIYSIKNYNASNFMYVYIFEEIKTKIRIEKLIKL